VTPTDRTERALDALARAAELAAPHELAGLFDACARQLGTDGALVYVVDLQQRRLQPLLGPEATTEQLAATALAVDGTLAGRAYQLVHPQTQNEGGRTRVWLPVGIGSHRLGVLVAVLPGELDPAVAVAISASRPSCTTPSYRP